MNRKETKKDVAAVKCYEGFKRKYCFRSVNVKLQQILIFSNYSWYDCSLFSFIIRVHGFLR